MLTTQLILFLVTLTEAARVKRHRNVDVTEDFDKPILFGNVHKDGRISNAFVPYAISQKQLDPPDEPPVDKRKKPTDVISSVRDMYEEKRKRGDKTKIPTRKESEARSRLWFDFEELLDKNDQKVNSGLSPVTPKSTDIGDHHPAPSNVKHFAKGSFMLKEHVKRKKHVNWTSCDQIGGDPKFHPKDIMDIEWLPFYTWSIWYLPPVYPHVFSIPSVKKVKEYQVKYQNKVNIKVDWKAPKMMMKENQELLLIAADRAGLFYGITNIELPEYAKTHPVEIAAIKLRLKIFDPYLFMMYCDYRYATVMAINGREPETDEAKTLEAATIPFHGQGQPMTRDFEAERMRQEAQIARKLEMELRYPELTVSRNEPGDNVGPLAILPD